jgi:two-component sensor histidine kinase
MNHHFDALETPTSQSFSEPVLATPPSHRHHIQGDDLLLRETNHRCSNDLQLVVSLQALHSRRAANPEVRAALADAMERVSILAHAPRALHQERPVTLEVALRQVCDAEPRSILVALEAVHDVRGLTANHVTTVTLVVNELATNAIKHAFEDSKAGHIRVTITGIEALVKYQDALGLLPDQECWKADRLSRACAERESHDRRFAQERRYIR